MPLFEAVRLALAQLRVQKLKSAFTLIGVTISVMFLIGIVSIVNGMGHYLQEDFAGRLFGGANVFTLRTRLQFNPAPPSPDARRQLIRRPPIYLRDVADVRSALPPGARYAVEAGRMGNSVGASSAYAPPRGVEPHAVEGQYFEIKRYDIAAGRAFSPQEAAIGARVIVIGDEVATHFFPGIDPVGRELRISGVSYTVLGVIGKQGNLFGESLDRLAIAPVRSPLGRQLGRGNVVSGVIVESPSLEVMNDAQDAVRTVMRSRHQLRPADPDDFAMETSAGALTFFERIRSIMTIAGTVLPAIGLVVGGIVIMNIMLMAVSERTPEIGVRKALGATRRDILSQFLVESVTLSTLGAIIGIGLGIALAEIVAWKTPLPARVAPWAVVLATVVGMAVGIVAGVYPASRASKLDPIEALRRE